MFMNEKIFLNLNIVSKFAKMFMNQKEGKEKEKQEKNQEETDENLGVKHTQGK